MKKVKLELDSLSVETFSTSETQADKGTVLANEYTETCRPDAMSLCGPNYCLPDTEPTTTTW